MTATSVRDGGQAEATQPARGRGRGRGLRRGLPMLGPAFVAAIAYVDPGNVATNVTAGSRFGYLLLWVVVAASAVAVCDLSFSSASTPPPPSAINAASASRR